MQARILPVGRIVAIGILLFALSDRLAAQQTSFLGFGPMMILPLDTLDVTTTESYGGTVGYMSRKYCSLWPGIRASVGISSGRDTLTLRPWYERTVMLSPELRWFFAQPTEFPLYLQGNLHLSSIVGSDSAAHAGLGLGGGLGYLLFYDSDCCNWFVDLTAQYQAPNLILRSDARPLLTAISVALTFNISL